MTDPDWVHHRPFRNYNPGDLRPRQRAPQWPGMTSVDHGSGGPFAIFASRPDGWAALGLWLLFAHDVMGLKTVSQKIHVFAPPSENDTTDYAAGVAAKVGENANPHDPAVRKALCKAIAHWEDYQAQWPEAEIDSGMTLCDARWPSFLVAAQGGCVAPVPHIAPAIAPDPDNSADALNQQQLDKDQNT